MYGNGVCLWGWGTLQEDDREAAVVGYFDKTTNEEDAKIYEEVRKYADYRYWWVVHCWDGSWWEVLLCVEGE